MGRGDGLGAGQIGDGALQVPVMVLVGQRALFLSFTGCTTANVGAPAESG